MILLHRRYEEELSPNKIMKPDSASADQPAHKERSLFTFSDLDSGESPPPLPHQPRGAPPDTNMTRDTPKL